MLILNRCKGVCRVVCVTMILGSAGLATTYRENAWWVQKPEDPLPFNDQANDNLRTVARSIDRSIRRTVHWNAHRSR